MSGWLVALPLTSGPIALFVAIEAGPNIARQVADGALVGAIGQVAFAAAYTFASTRVDWRASLALATACFLGVGFAVPDVAPVLGYLGLIVAIVAFLAAIGARETASNLAAPPPTWDIPARVVVATILVVAISSLAPFLGGRVSGVLATFPVYGSVLTTFAHVTRGSGAAAQVLRGLATGLVGFGAFFLTLDLLLPSLGIPRAFLVASAVGLLVQAATWPLIRRR